MQPAVHPSMREPVHDGEFMTPVQVTLVDTAGLRESTDEIERMGMERARSAMTSADIIAVVMDLQTEPHLAAALHQQGQAPGDVSDSASESPIMTLARNLMTQVTDLEGDGGPSSAAAAASGASESASEREASAEEAEDTLMRPQHQRTLLVLNKCDLQPMPQPAMSSAAASAGSSSQLQPSSSSDSSINGCSPIGNHVAASTQAGMGPASSDQSGSSASVQRPGTLQAQHGQIERVAEAVAISCRTGEGLDRLLARLSALVAEITDTGDAGEGGAIITRLFLQDCQLYGHACALMQAAPCHLQHDPVGYRESQDVTTSEAVTTA